MYEIEKGVKAPSAGRKYPFKQMAVGDSFAFPMQDRTKIGVAAGHVFGKGNYRTRKINDTTGRIWRTK